jgi:hypothetical protein
VRGRRPGQRDDHRAAVLSVSTPDTVTVAGRELTFPIEVRRASSWAAQFAVNARAAERLVDGTGLRIAKVAPNSGLCVLTFVRYEDTDLDAYHELGVILLVRGPRGRGVYIHRLPVNQEFTMHAGRELWGFPKFLADIDIHEQPGATTCHLRHEDRDVLELTIRNGPLPMPQPAIPTYTFLDGMLRATTWETSGGARGRPGGAAIRLGTGPLADELRSLGLPKRALATSAVAAFRARFGPAETLSR